MWMIRVENLPHFLSQKNGRNNAEFGNCVPHRCFIKSQPVKNLPHRLDFSIPAFYVGKKSQCSQVIVHLMFQISHYLTLTIPDRKSLTGWMTFQSRLKASHISTFDAVILPLSVCCPGLEHWWCSHQGHDKCSRSFSVFMHVCSKKCWWCGGSDGWAKILSMCSIRWISLYLGPWYSFSVKLI